ncbi:MAG: hypothetical protein ACO3L1_02550 [Flavobacteriaceae bacterium]
MKKNFLLLSVLLTLMWSCSQKAEPLSEAELRAQLVVQAHGLEAFQEVSKIAFTRGVARAEGNFERRWIWNTQNDTVTRIMNGDSVSYNWKRLDSVSNEINKGFINDKYWLFAPLQLAWDKGSYTVSLEKEVESLGQGKLLDKLTITYGNTGGYTPGDAYDFYVDKDHVVREWVFRRGAAEEPSIVSICEDYITLNGLLMAQKHSRSGQESYRYLSDIIVE